jgi:hypothetical protein
MYSEQTEILDSPTDPIEEEPTPDPLPVDDSSPTDEQTDQVDASLLKINAQSLEIIELKAQIKSLTSQLAEQSALSSSQTKLSHPTRARPSRRAVKAVAAEPVDAETKEEEGVRDVESVKKQRTAGGFNLV